MSTMDTYNDPAPRVRPRALTVICVLVIVFSALGFLVGCFGLISQLFASQVQQALVAGQSGANGAAGGAQAEMLARTMEISAKYAPVLVPLTILKIAVEAALLIGAIMTLGYKPSGRSLLAGALVGAIILESIQYVPTFMLQRESQAIAAEMMPKIMAAQSGANNLPPGMDMSSMMSGIGAVTMIFTLIWLAAKIVLYLLGTRYLRKPSVVALFPTASN